MCSQLISGVVSLTYHLFTGSSLSHVKVSRTRRRAQVVQTSFNAVSQLWYGNGEIRSTVRYSRDLHNRSHSLNGNFDSIRSSVRVIK
jgi:hypothetical protein